MSEQVNRAEEQGDETRADTLARELFANIANKWALLIINALGEETLRFTQIHTAVEGISHKMLTQTLRNLERDGVVQRYVHPVFPPHVDYSLTEAGLVLRTTVNVLCTWTRTHVGVISEARRRFDAR